MCSKSLQTVNCLEHKGHNENTKCTKKNSKLKNSKNHVRNNIIKSSVQVASSPPVHSYNRYFMTGGAPVGYSLGTAETTGDPLFVDSAAADYHLQAASPAKGLRLMRAIMPHEPG